MRNLFIVHDKEQRDRFIKILSKQLNTKVDWFSYCGRDVVQVEDDKYIEAYLSGIKLAKNYNIKITPLNYYGELLNNGYFQTMYLGLSSGREQAIHGIYYSENEFENLPPDFALYLKNLKSFLNNKKLYVKYNKADNALELFVECSIDEWDLVSKQCRGFNSVEEDIPFISTIYTDITGKLINKENEEKRIADNIESYVMKSCGIVGMLHPEESNIARKTPEYEPDYSKSGYVHRGRSYGADKFDIYFDHDYYDKIEGHTNIYKGEAVLNESKHYDYYDRSINNFRNLNIFDYTYKLKDNVTFRANVIINEYGCFVENSMKVIRNVFGYDFTNESIRDGVFFGTKHTDDTTIYAYRDEYIKIANGSRLLHFTNQSEFFEVYELPENWKYEDGIDKLDCPKVFDDYKFDNNDKDLDEISDVMNRDVKKLSLKN